MKTIGVIPARFASTRFEGKPLKVIAGKPLLQWVIEGALQAKNLDELMVATDHEDIALLAKRCGVKPVMTAPELPSGSDRIWAAVNALKFDVVINIQGDEPLIAGPVVDTLIEGCRDPKVQMATLARKFKDLDEVRSSQTAKIVIDHESQALYFSRLPIPLSKYSPGSIEDLPCLKHIGLYAYQKSFLETFCTTPPASIEKAEGLEQLRALWLGAKIKVILTEYESWGVDTPEDVIRVEKLLDARLRRDS